MNGQGVRVVKGNPVITGTLSNHKMADTLREKVAEVVYKKMEEVNCKSTGYMTVLERADQAAAEIIKLFEAEDKTLTLLAADLDIPLWKAMQLAGYRKKQYKEFILAELPKREWGHPDSGWEVGYKAGWNDYDEEIRRRLTEGK